MKIISKFLQEEKTFEKKDSVKAIIKDSDGKILIIRRGEHSAGSGKWDLPGGGIESKENKNDALKREIFEETNLKIKNPKFIKKITFKIPETGVNSDMNIYTCEIDGDRIEVKLKPAAWDKPEHKPEHTEIKWIQYKHEMEILPMWEEMKEVVIKELEKKEEQKPEMECVDGTQKKSLQFDRKFQK